MNTAIDDQLKSIQGKLQQLLKQYQLLQKENRQLKAALEEAKTAADTKTSQLYSLQRQVDALKLGVQGWSDEAKVALEKRIDDYLKEIEKCLALLND